MGEVGRVHRVPTHHQPFVVRPRDTLGPALGARGPTDRDAVIGVDGMRVGVLGNPRAVAGPRACRSPQSTLIAPSTSLGPKYRTLASDGISPANPTTSAATARLPIRSAVRKASIAPMVAQFDDLVPAVLHRQRGDDGPHPPAGEIGQRQFDDVGQLDGEDRALADTVVQQDGRELRPPGGSDRSRTARWPGRSTRSRLVRGVDDGELVAEVGDPVSEQLLHRLFGPPALAGVLGDPRCRVHLHRWHCLRGLLVVVYVRPGVADRWEGIHGQPPSDGFPIGWVQLISGDDLAYRLERLVGWRSTCSVWKPENPVICRRGAQPGDAVDQHRARVVLVAGRLDHALLGQSVAGLRRPAAAC